MSGGAMSENNSPAERMTKNAAKLTPKQQPERKPVFPEIKPVQFSLCTFRFKPGKLVSTKFTSDIG